MSHGGGPSVAGPTVGFMAPTAADDSAPMRSAKRRLAVESAFARSMDTYGMRRYR